MAVIDDDEGDLVQYVEEEFDEDEDEVLVLDDDDQEIGVVEETFRDDDDDVVLESYDSHEIEEEEVLVVESYDSVEGDLEAEALEEEMEEIVDDELINLDVGEETVHDDGDGDEILVVESDDDVELEEPETIMTQSLEANEGDIIEETLHDDDDVDVEILLEETGDSEELVPLDVNEITDDEEEEIEEEIIEERFVEEAEITEEEELVESGVTNEGGRVVMEEEVLEEELVEEIITSEDQDSTMEIEDEEEVLELIEDAVIEVEPSPTPSPEGAVRKSEQAQEQRESSQDGEPKPPPQRWIDFRNETLPADLLEANQRLIAVIYANDDEVDTDSMFRRTPPKELYKYLKQQYWYKVHNDELEKDALEKYVPGAASKRQQDSQGEQHSTQPKTPDRASLSGSTIVSQNKLFFEKRVPERPVIGRQTVPNGVTTIQTKDDHEVDKRHTRISADEKATAAEEEAHRRVWEEEASIAVDTRIAEEEMAAEEELQNERQEDARRMAGQQQRSAAQKATVGNIAEDKLHEVTESSIEKENAAETANRGSKVVEEALGRTPEGEIDSKKLAREDKGQPLIAREPVDSEENEQIFQKKQVPTVDRTGGTEYEAHDELHTSSVMAPKGMKAEAINPTKGVPADSFETGPNNEASKAAKKKVWWEEELLFVVAVPILIAVGVTCFGKLIYGSD